MSAFVVDKVHIDALVTAGLKLASRYGPMKWTDRGPTDEEISDTHVRGQSIPYGSMVWYSEHKRELTSETAGRVGAMLLAENVRSVNHRYDEEEWEQPYEFSQLRGTPDPRVVLEAIACYEYQSCEHPEWERSEAYRFCDTLRRECVRLLTGDVSVWEITDPAIFTKRTTRANNA